MTKVDVDKLDPSLLRAFYKGYIKRHPYLPPDFKKQINVMVGKHFAIMASEIGLIELAWRRTKDEKSKNVLIAFGDRYAPMKKKQVHWALLEAQKIVPVPEILLFIAFEFDPVAEQDIEEITWPGVILLKAKINADLNTKDLNKKRP